MINAVAHIAYVPGLGKLVGCTSQNSKAIFEQRTETDSEAIADVLVPIHADFAKTANITAVVDSTSTVLGGESTVTVNSGTWSPEVGDAFVYAQSVYVVTQDNGATIKVRPSLTATAQAVTAAYVAFESELEWQYLGQIGVAAMFREVAFLFDNGRLVERIDYTGTNDQGESTNVAVVNDRTFGTVSGTTQDIPMQIRAMNTRDCARANLLRPAIAIKAALSAWRLVGMRSTYLPISTQVSK
jgi:hypothetical protein